MQNYNELFKEAAALSKKLGLEEISQDLNGKPLVAEWLMLELGPKIAEYFSRDGFIKFLGTAHASIRLHHLFQPIVNTLLNIETTFTTGYVKVANDAKEIEEFGNISSEDLQKALDEEKVPEKIHAWLTLPSGEIIDLAFMTIYGILYSEDSLMGSLLAKDPKELSGGMEFCPIILGTEFYEKCQFDFKINFSELEQNEDEDA